MKEPQETSRRPVRAKYLKPGDKLLSNGREYVFIERVRATDLRIYSWFRCEAFKGVNGREDPALVRMTDYEVAKTCVRVAK